MKRLLIRNGVVIDPASGLHERREIVVENGKIAGINQDGTTEEKQDDLEILDASGCLVVPGLIDIHVHVFPGKTSLGVNADRVGVQQGVATVVDAGSAGARNFEAFTDEVIRKSQTRVLSWLNIADAGLGAGNSELADLNRLDVAAALECIQKNRDICGIKVRMSSSVLGTNRLQPLEIAKKTANKAQVPLMVHIGNAPPALGDILDLLDKGDVVTHIFHGKEGGIFGRDKKLIAQARRALERGVLFDVGHGVASFSFKTMAIAREAGIHPATISTDLHRRNYQGPVYSLVRTLSKFLAFGYSLEEVLAAATVAPARLLRLAGSIGSLAVGRVADISILALREGRYDFFDADNNHLVGHQLLQPRYTIRTGRVLTANADT